MLLFVSFSAFSIQAIGACLAASVHQLFKTNNRSWFSADVDMNYIAPRYAKWRWFPLFGFILARCFSPAPPPVSQIDRKKIFIAFFLLIFIIMRRQPLLPLDWKWNDGYKWANKLPLFEQIQLCSRDKHFFSNRLPFSKTEMIFNYFGFAFEMQRNICLFYFIFKTINFRYLTFRKVWLNSAFYYENLCKMHRCHITIPLKSAWPGLAFARKVRFKTMN